MELNNHPCFNEGACSSHGRIHLPVAPLCNVQCNFCNRKYDCVNESRPGVTSSVLTPFQAFDYLDEMLSERGNISVVGIAGPGDPFANPDETLKTLELVRKGFPEMILCLATNGLNLLPYVDDVVNLKVSHISITVNAVDPEIGSRIYAWIRNGKRTMSPRDGAEILLENQIKAVSCLKEKGMIIKINSVVLPGINDLHIPKVAESMGAMGVDIFNCMPYAPSPGSRFECLGEPDAETIRNIRELSGRFVKQIRHCTRCRADAAGLLKEGPDPVVIKKLKRFAETTPKVVPLKKTNVRPYVAVASMEGTLVNQHLGEAARLFIYGFNDDEVSLVDIRQTPEPGGGDDRWGDLSTIISDCGSVLVSGIGTRPKTVLSRNGIEAYEVEGIIEDALLALFTGGSINGFTKRPMPRCGEGCSGGGIGCG